MTAVRVGFVDVYPLRQSVNGLEALLLRRAPGQSRPETWEGVHGKMDPGEAPVEAARRELREETGFAAKALYNLSRVEPIYMHRADEVILVPAFAAMVTVGADPILSDEHDAFEWMPIAAAQERCSWPRAARCLADAARILRDGDAGLLESVLRVP